MDKSKVEVFVDDILEKHPNKVKEYRQGKTSLLSFFLGEVIKNSNGKAPPNMTNKLLIEKLNNSNK